MKLLEFRPKLFDCLKNYSKRTFASDLMAGIIVGIVALPLAIAFGIASGVSPEKGLITAIIGGFIVSFLGGSNVQIGGPTGAFIVIVAGIISQYGIEGLAIATVMAGIILVLLGLFKLGVVIKFIPYPIIVGFTAGVIGIGLTLLINIPINVIVHNLTGIYSINSTLPAVGGIALVLISVALTYIAGLIPAGIAVKKDPVEALRTE